MLKIGLFCVFLPFALAEMFYNHSFGMILIGTLYMGLSLQADFAARRLAQQGLVARDANGNPVPRRRWNDPEEDWIEELKVSPLGEKPSSSPQDTAWVPPRGAFQQTDPFPGAPSAPAPEAAKAPPIVERRRTPRGSASGPKPLPASPNFHGRDHELLGVGENARTRTIVNAFRHWIKKFHPDQNQTLPVALANQRVMRLTEAKERLLARRRAQKAA